MSSGAQAASAGSVLSPGFMAMLQRLALSLGGRVRGQIRGERRSIHRGHGGDFADMRPYTTGDDLRHLDWTVYARLDALVVRLYEEPREETVHLLVDASASMACGKETFTRQLAAALGYLALCAMDRVGLHLLSEGSCRSIGPFRGKRTASRLLAAIDQIPFGGATAIAESIRAFEASRPRGTALVMSDFLVADGRDEAITALRRARLRGAVIHILADSERRPPAEGELTLVDAETGEELMVTITRSMRRAYLSRLAALEGELRDVTTRYGLAFVPTTSSDSIEELILGDLQRRGIVGRGLR